MKTKLLLLSTLLAVGLASCGGGEGGGQEETTSSLSSESTSEGQEFTGITFASKTVTFDGETHILDEVSGAPEGTAIQYQGRSAYTNVGVYNATATLSKEGYKTTTLQASLTINAADFSGFTYDDVTVTYDGADHIEDIKLVGARPEGTSVKQTVKNASGQVVTSAIDVGTYSFSIDITNSNFNKLTLDATLTIRAAKKEVMPVFSASDGMTYFSNGLDNKYLYSVSSSGELNRIDFSAPKKFSKYSSSKALFIGGTPVLNSAKEVSGGNVETLYTKGNIDDFVKYSDTVYYYASNSLKASSSGIYKVDATSSGEEPTVTKVFEGKTNNLAIAGDYLYFTNGNDKDHIYKMNLSTRSSSLVLGEKVHEFTIQSNRLYCTIDGLVNDYIGYIDLGSSSTEPTKLTNTAGEFLKIKNNKLYYNYTDMLGAIDASKYGIWSIDLSNNTETHLVAASSINGFDVESSSTLVYIDTNDSHLYRYNISTKIRTDLLDGFVAPESTPINTGSTTVAYGNKVYYLDMYAGKTLWAYDEVAHSKYQVSTGKVADFYITGDTLFFNQVTMLTNNDLYRLNLKTSEEAETISSNDVRGMVSDGTYLYGVHYNFAGVAAGLARMKLDGSEYVKFSEVNGAKNLTIKGGNLYFINCATGQDNGNVEYIALADITASSTKLTSTNLSKNIKNVKQFLFDDANIYYIYNGTIDNSIRRASLATLDEGTKIASSKTNPSEMILKGNTIYYYSYAASAASAAGFYKVDKGASGDGTQELILGYNSTYYGTSFAITASNKLYFLNYIPKLLLGDAHFYQLDVASKAVSKIA